MILKYRLQDTPNLSMKIHKISIIKGTDTRLDCGFFCQRDFMCQRDHYVYSSDFLICYFP